ncbi:MAG: hypothetical protein ACFFCT_07915 [Candidatus Odinarchaeota archaeon]
MNKSKSYALLGLILLIAVAYQPANVAAHPPGPITLAYDIDTEILTVTVTHVTADVNTHYVYEIVIEKNSVVFTTESYTSQSSASGMSDTFSVPASNGDILRATAKCSVSGQTSQQMTVSDITATTTTTTTTTTTDSWLPTTLMILVVIFALAVVMVIVWVLRRR